MTAPGATLPDLLAKMKAIIAEIECLDGKQHGREGHTVAKGEAVERLLTLKEAAALLKVTPRWLRETRPPYVVQLGDRTLRVSEQKLQRFLGSR